MRNRVLGLCLAVCLLDSGCWSPGPTHQGVVLAAPDGRRALERIVIGVPVVDLHPTVGSTRGTVNPLVNPGLSILDDQRVLRPVLAEAVPSLENGLWKLLPDGRMETTWTIRAGARWHDGSPLTVDDLLFTLRAGRELPGQGDPALSLIQEAVARDSRTLTVVWSQPFIEADRLFSFRLAVPLPRHLLEEPALRDPASFPQLPFWGEDYVGSGPFRIREWVPGVRVLLEAVPDCVLGAPRVDEVEVQIIPNSSVLMTNLLAGTMHLAPVVESIDWGLQIREQWRDGTVRFADGDGWIALFPQFVNPDPVVLADVRFRRALLHALDRQALAESLSSGWSSVPHSFLSPNQPEYQEIEARLPRYEYDPRRATQLIEELGYRRGPDSQYRDASGEKLEIRVHVTGTLDRDVQAAEAIRDAWSRFGVSAVTPLRRNAMVEGREHLAEFPAFQVRSTGKDTSALMALHSSRARLPENGYGAPSPQNHSRYMNAELDTLVERYRMTMPVPERTRILGEIIYHVADQVVVAGVYHQPLVVAVADRVANVRPASGRTGWNSHEWELRR